MKKYLVFISFWIISAGCSLHEKHFKDVNPLINLFNNTVYQRYLPPDGYEGIWEDDTTMGWHLKSLPLKPYGNTASISHDETVSMGVVDKQFGKNVKQDVADPIVFLWAEFLYLNSKYDEMNFCFDNGFCMPYSKWQAGQRVSMEGDKLAWVQSDTANNDWYTFNAYMDTLMAHSGVVALDREMVHAPYGDIRTGDVLLDKNAPSHAVIVVYMAYHQHPLKKVYMLAAWSAKAGEFQILANPNNKDISPWYQLDPDAKEIKTPDWTFSTADLRRFKNN